MNRINPNKLMHSKWTAARPVRKEKHFLVTEVWRDEEEHVVDVSLEAVFTGKTYRLHWRELTDDDHWLTGWRRPGT